MFDWNDEEITNIIWGEARESGDHIVPYPDGSEEKSSGLCEARTRKHWNEEAGNVNPEGQKKHAEGTDFHEFRLASSPSKVAKTKQAMGTEASNSLIDVCGHDSSRHGETARVDISDEQKMEQGDYFDYDWANIGSFDDFDRIFRNDDPIFGHASLGNTEELWSSSKDFNSSPQKSIPLPFESPSLAVGELGSSSDQFGFKSEYVLDQESFGSGYRKMTNVTSITPKNVTCSDSMRYAVGKSKPLQKEKIATEACGKTQAFKMQLSAGVLAAPDEFTDKGNRKKRLLKPQAKSEEKRQKQWSTFGNQQLLQFDSQYASTMRQPYPPPLLKSQRLGSESSQYKDFSGPFLASSMYANISNRYPPMNAFSQLPLVEGNHQKVLLSGYEEVSPVNSDPQNTLSYTPSQPLPMTPQEKIEKLRRRQQMRAMLAIQKQQQQFNNQVSSSTEPPIMEGAENNLYILPSIDPSSHAEQDDSDDCSAEDSILQRLHDIIMKLDIRIRLCIRDSLFRLAQSATQRQFSSDTSSSNRSGRDEIFNQEERNTPNRFDRIADVETETNPIDRTVAHLLFHSPLEPSGKHAERLLPLPACDRNEADSMTGLP